MIRIHEHGDQLLLTYEPDNYNDVKWVDEKLKQYGEVTLRRTFTFESNRLIGSSNQGDSLEEARTFLLGVIDGDFYRIGRDILGLQSDLLLSTNLNVSERSFVAVRNVSIFSKIDELIKEPIVIGGDTEGSLPVEEFEELIRQFPTYTEMHHYVNARISRILIDHFETATDAQKKLDDHLKKKQKLIRPLRLTAIHEYEIEKFEYIRDELTNMLEDFDSYSEHDWRKLIVRFLLLIFPKYIAVLENLQVKDFYSDPGKILNRYIDLTLVDYSGTIDIVEIKRPFSNCVLSRTRYRDNYIPKKELSGSVMQVEKYIFHLNKWGRAGEHEILKKRKSELPPNFEIRVTSPKAMIILGRDTDFAKDQEFDFEIIKRKYNNVIDIMTYDDLLRRLENMIVMIARSNSSGNSL